MTELVARRPLFEVTGLRFRLWPIIVAAIAMESMLRLGRVPARMIYKAGFPAWDGHVWIYIGLAIIFQALIGLAGILVMRRVMPAAEFNLRWPPGKSYVGLAVVVGFGMALTMLIADYWPQLIAGAALDTSYPTAPADAAGWLGAMAITGFAEETIFRGLLVGTLVVLVPGRVRLGGFEVPFAGVIVALMFCAAHWQSFVVDPLHMAIAQQSYAFLWGLIYVWLMERSRSLLAPIVAHGISNAAEVGIVMLFTVLA
jgi:membrane protease YdiL (CAAX protease family)